MKKILVTGGAGYIGSSIVHQLIEDGNDVIVFDNLENGHLKAIPQSAHFFNGDLRNYIDILQCLNQHLPDAIIHMASYAYVGESMKDPHKYYDNNVRGAINLMRAIRFCDNVKKLVFSSSCATYGTPDTLPIHESMPQNPENPYGETKLTVERMIKWYASNIPDFTYTFLRYFNAAGAIPKLGIGEDHDPETHLIPLVIGAALGTNPYLKVFGTNYNTPDGTCIRDYVHIKDLASAHMLALKDPVSAAFNLGIGVGYSVMDVIKCVEEVSGIKVPHTLEDMRPGDSTALYADNKKATRLLGWKPEHSSLQNIIETAWEWHTLNPEGFLR